MGVCDTLCSQIKISLVIVKNIQYYIVKIRNERSFLEKNKNVNKKFVNANFAR